jgi:hypothetical protein
MRREQELTRMREVGKKVGLALFVQPDDSVELRSNGKGSLADAPPGNTHPVVGVKVDCTKLRKGVWAWMLQTRRNPRLHIRVSKKVLVF